MYLSKSRFSVATILGGLLLVAASNLPAEDAPKTTPPDRDAKAEAPDQNQDENVQVQRQRIRTEARSETGREGRAGRTDGQLAGWLVVDNEGEVALSKLGQERSQNEQVKQFAQKMVDEHSQMLTKLQKFARPGGAEATTESETQIRSESTTRPRGDARARGERGAERREGAEAKTGDDDKPADPNAEGTTTRTTTTVREDQPGPQGRIGLVALKKELGEECLQSKRQALEGKEGAEFDKCFMGMQIAAHMGAIDTMKVFKRHASPELAQVLEEGIQTAQGHLEHAEGIIKQLEGKAAAETATTNN